MRKRIFIYSIISGCLLAFALCVNQGLAAEDDLEPGVKLIGKQDKNLRGEIGSINNDFITLIYKRDEKKGIEYEMLLPLDKNIQLKNRKNLKDFKEGDTVVIQYEESTVEYQGKDEGGIEPRQQVRRKAKVISFVKSAKKKPEIFREEVPEE